MVAYWMSKAWKQMSADVIQKSFKKSCISNALDGTDDVLWQDEDDTDEQFSSSSDNKSPSSADDDAEDDD